MKKMVGKKVTINIPNKNSRFHNKKGTIKYKSDIGGRWFVHLEGDKRGVDTEFCNDEIILSR